MKGVKSTFVSYTYLTRVNRRFDPIDLVIRLMTPIGKRYSDAYAMAHPFNSMIDGMMSSRMIDETVELMLEAIDKGIHINVLINNRAGGNAPIIAQIIAERFLENHPIHE